MCVSPLSNTVAAFQIFFIERIFVFFMTLFLKKMGIILRASKPQCHSRLSKPILRILSIYRKIYLREKTFLSQTVHRCSMKKML